MSDIEPVQLNPETPAKYVKGIGPKRAVALEGLGIRTFFDLLYYFPRKYLDRSTIAKIAQLRVGEELTIVGKVISQSLIQGRGRRRYQILVGDDSGIITCVWFNGINYIKNAFKNGDWVAMSGKVEFFNGPQLIHPEYDKLGKGEWDPVHTSRIIPLYPSTAELKKVGLDSRGFRRVYKSIFKKYAINLEETLPIPLLGKYKLPFLNEAIQQIHFPESINSLEKARSRFKLEELFYLQLILGIKREGIKSAQKPHRYKSPGLLLKKVHEKLPFELTEAQKRVVHEIWNDMKSPEVMNRLLQGDVGSGKTVVALLCASIAIGNGYQVAMMAPTEILAEQHYRNLKKLGKSAGIEPHLLIGGQKKKEREIILKKIKDGSAKLVIGTHALIQEGVEFKNLSLVIIDEQHRFGVVQRSQLIKKGLNSDILIMTATPIPRTLSITLYGDMDISILDQMPARKGKIITKLVNEDKLPIVYEYIREQVRKGGQAYIVFPLIEESEKMDLQAAIQGYEYLSKEVFSELRLALLYGSMSTAEKDEIMKNFNNGTVDILVSTTVVEVGVDNPNATIMLIENAERFGLTQIHQLRGRIGRGEKNGVCVLVERKRSENSHRRLRTLLATSDGFEISEEDLKLRGPGEFYSTRQHGFPKMKIADLIEDKELLKIARREAFDLLKKDPHLRRNEDMGIRNNLLNNYSEYLEFINIL